MRGDYYLLNDNFLPAAELAGNNTNAVVVYEVVRIINGVPVFFNDHFQRLHHSCKLTGHQIDIDKNKLHRQFEYLSVKNSIEIGNVMLKVIFEPGKQTRQLYFIPHSYPSEEDYEKGVTVGILHAERINPEAKVEQGVRERANQILKDSTYYEVLLVDHDGYITEGSRSNLFFIKDDKLYTCPLHKVLRGITLTKVLQIAEENTIQVVFEPVHESTIATYDAAFITGTSPKILPLNAIERTTYKVDNQPMSFIMKKYNQLMDDDLKQRVEKDINH